MRKGKVLAVIIAVFMTFGMFGVLTGCKKNKESYDFWVAAIEGGYGREHWDSVTREFKRVYDAAHSTETSKSDIKIKLTIAHNIEDEITSPLSVNQGPDFVHLATQREKGLTESMYSGTNKLFKLNDLLNEKVYNEDVTLGEKFLPHALGYGVTNPITSEPDSHYMLPIAMGTAGLYYNKTLFDAAIDWPTDLTNLTLAQITSGGKYALPQTMEQMLAMGKALDTARAADNKIPYLFTYPTGGYFDTMIPSLIASSGGQATLDKFFGYEKNIFQNDSVKRVYEDLAALSKFCEPTTASHANATNSNWQLNQQLVMQNKALFQPNGNWVMGEMAAYEAADNFVWASMPFPGYVNDGQIDRYAKLHMEQVWLPKNGATTMKPIAKEFVLFLYSKAGLAEMAKGTNLLVPVHGYLDIVDAYMDPLLVADAESYYTATDLKVATGAFKSFDSFAFAGGYGNGQMDAKRYKESFWCGGMDQLLAGSSGLYNSAETWLTANNTVNNAIADKLA